ncbi:MAG: DUF3617 domain-containing protein [Burkholderiales bacterium]
MRLALAIALAAACLPAAAQTMEPGEWQFDSTMTSPTLPKPQSATITQCVSKAEAEDATRFTGKDQSADCQVTPGSRTADSYSWTLSCPQQGMRGAGKARFGRDTIDSEVQMTVEMQGQKMEMTSRTAGRLLGPCRTK